MLSQGKNKLIKGLKLPIYSHFCRPDWVILTRLKKIKKNMEQSKFSFSSPGLYIGRIIKKNKRIKRNKNHIKKKIKKICHNRN